MSTFNAEVAQLVANNEKYASTFNGAPTMEQLQAALKTKDGRAHLILTCLDPRCVPEAYFGPGLRAAVHRNAGGRVTTDVVRSVNVLRALLHLKTVVVVHHTDCGVTHVTEDEVREYAKSKNPAAAATVDKMDFDLFEEKHLADSVREDVLRLRGEKSLDGLEVFGFTLDTQTGAVTPVQV